MDVSVAPDLSVVVGASEGQPDPTACLLALSAQARRRAVEILFVVPVGHPAAAVAKRFPAVTVIESERSRLVPELWGLGVLQARAPIVAITISGCVPAPDWVDRTIALHAGAGGPGVADAAVGGAIEQADPAGLTDWAVYFVRYASYMRPFAAREVSDVPGDNGTYKVSALQDDRALIERDGFWETTINRRLRTRGQTLRMDPALAVFHTHSYDWRGFSRQRFRHGCLFGRERRAALGAAAWARVALAPVSFAAMLLRSVRHVRQRGRHQQMMILALPLTAWFYACWIAGETVGLAGGGDTAVKAGR